VAAVAVVKGRDKRVPPGERPEIDRAILLGPEESVDSVVRGRAKVARDIAVVIDGGRFLESRSRQTEVDRIADAFCLKCVTIGADLSDMSFSHWQSRADDLTGIIYVVSRVEDETNSCHKDFDELTWVDA
jgi:hypothetical protein